MTANPTVEVKVVHLRDVEWQSWRDGTVTWRVDADVVLTDEGSATVTVLRMVQDGDDYPHTLRSVGWNRSQCFELENDLVNRAEAA